MVFEKVDKNPDEIEFEKNQHEMLFTPEVHEINVRGTKKPIKGGGIKKGGQIRGRM